MSADEHRQAALTIASRSTSPDDCRDLLAMLGLLPTPTKRGPGRPSVDRGHGHDATYRKGCGCDACREAHRKRCADYREARAADPSAADRAGHGSASTYKNYRCRCSPCSRANSAAVAAFRAGRAARKAGAA